MAHAAFDPMIDAKMARDGCSRSKARRAGYGWLALNLGLERRDCHIGMFDEAMCARVLELCRRRPRMPEPAGGTLQFVSAEPLPQTWTPGMAAI